MIVARDEDFIIVKYPSYLDSARRRLIGHYRVDLVGWILSSKCTDHVCNHAIGVLLAERADKSLPDLCDVELHLFLCITLHLFDFFGVIFFSVLTGMYPCHIQIVLFDITLFALSQQLTEIDRRWVNPPYLAYQFLTVFHGLLLFVFMDIRLSFR